MEHRLNSNSYTKLYFQALNGCLGFFYFGYSVGILNLSQQTVFEVLDIDNDIIQSFCNSNLSIGALIAVVFSGFIVPKLTRRRLLMLIDFIGALGCFLCAVKNVPVFLTGRIIVGIATGLNSLAGPIYISEMSPPQISGTTGVMNSVMFNVGTIASYSTGYGFIGKDKNTIPNQYWQIIMALPALTCALRSILLLSVFKTEPSKKMELEPQVQPILGRIKRAPSLEKGSQLNKKYLVNQKREENIQSLQSDDSEVFTKLIQKPQAKKTNDQNSYLHMFQQRYRSRLFIAVLLQVLQQFSGINSIFYYSSEIFGDVTDNESLITTLTVMIGVVGFVFSFICSVVIQFVGRKSMILVGTFIGDVINLVVLAWFTRANAPQTTTEQYVTIFCVFFYMTCFQLSLGPIVWLYNAEILPEKGVTLATMANWTSGVIITFTFNLMVDAIGISNCYYFFAGCSTIGCIIIYRYMKETKGLSFDEIEQIFKSKDGKN